MEKNLAITNQFPVKAENFLVFLFLLASQTADLTVHNTLDTVFSGFDECVVFRGLSFRDIPENMHFPGQRSEIDL